MTITICDHGQVVRTCGRCERGASLRRAAVCDHGQLARSCDLCERDAEIARLQRIEAAARAWHAARDAAIRGGNWLPGAPVRRYEDAIEVLAAVLTVSGDGAGGVSQSELARRFGVHPKTVNRIVNGRGWRQATDAAVRAARGEVHHAE